MKDVIVLPCHKLVSVPRGSLWEELHNGGFVITGFEISTVDVENICQKKLNDLFSDRISLSDEVMKLKFVRAVEKGIVKVKADGELNGGKNWFTLQVQDNFQFTLSRPQNYDTYWKVKVNFAIRHFYEYELLLSNIPKQTNIPFQRKSGKCPICSKAFPVQILNSHPSHCGEVSSADKIEEWVSTIPISNHFPLNRPSPSVATNIRPAPSLSTIPRPTGTLSSIVRSTFAIGV